MAVVWGAPHAALYSKAGANVIVPSDDASYITDSNLVVDGGLTAGTGQPAFRKLADKVG